MANFKTRAVTADEFKSIVSTIRNGFTTVSGVRVRPSPVVAAALLAQGNLGLRIGDICRLKLSDFVYENGRYRFGSFVEEKTKKVRTLPISSEFYAHLQSYAIKNGIGESDLLFPVSVRTVQHHLKQATDYLHITGVSSHSMRKFLATSLYSQTKDPELVRSVLLHSSIQVTQNYLSIEPEAVGQALQNHFVLPA